MHDVKFQRLKPGMSHMVMNSDVHFARVVGDKSTHRLCVFINEKATPVATVTGSPETPLM